MTAERKVEITPSENSRAYRFPTIHEMFRQTLQVWVNTIYESRAQAELLEFITSPTYLGIEVPPGEGQKLLIVTGLGGFDELLLPTLAYLRRIGYDPYTPGFTVFEPNTPLEKNMKKINITAQRLREKQGKPIIAIGHSLGGLELGESAREHPNLYKMIISNGSPINLNVSQNRPDTLVASFAKMLIKLDPDPHNRFKRLLSSREDLSGLPPLPNHIRRISFTSQEDTVVPWQDSVLPKEKGETYILRHGTHGGYPWRSDVMKQTAFILANEEAPPPVCHNIFKVV